MFKIFRYESEVSKSPGMQIGLFKPVGPYIKYRGLELPLNVEIVQKLFARNVFIQMKHFKPMPPQKQKIFSKNNPNADPFQYPCVPIRRLEVGLQK